MADIDGQIAKKREDVAKIQNKTNEAGKKPGIFSQAKSAIGSAVTSVAGKVGLAEENHEPVTTMPSKDWEPYSTNNVPVDPETHADTVGRNKKTATDALASFKIGLKKMLEELDDVVAEEEADTDVEIMTEDGEGAGGEATEGVTTGHIAGFMGRTGLGLQRGPRRKELCKNVPGICESYFSGIEAPEVVINEGSYYPTLNRHTLFEKLEKHIDGQYLNESSCSHHARRKALREQLKPTASIKESAAFLAENRFSCDAGKYIPREKKLDEQSLFETMNKLHASMMRKLKKF